MFDVTLIRCFWQWRSTFGFERDQFIIKVQVDLLMGIFDSIQFGSK